MSTIGTYYCQILKPHEDYHWCKENVALKLACICGAENEVLRMNLKNQLLRTHVPTITFHSIS